MKLRHWIASAVLLSSVLGGGALLAAWKHESLQQADAAARAQPEPAEVITVAAARSIEHRRTTTSIGTVRALRSITLRNELPGTVDQVTLESGAIVEAGTVLVTLDVSVEQAELQAQESQAALAETLLRRMERASQTRAASELDVERARAERDVALAQIARTKAIIARKTIRAPFKARVGMADVHKGQYLQGGTELTTLQGIDDSAHVDFSVAQPVAAGLAQGQHVEVFPSSAAQEPILAEIVAVDARIDPATRNASVRALIQDATLAPAPGASVRVRVPVGPPEQMVAIPVTALRRGPAGDHVFVVQPDEQGNLRAQVRGVRTGAMLGAEILVREGLDAGERVAASGSFKLREGVLVVVQEDAGGKGNG